MRVPHPPRFTLRRVGTIALDLDFSTAVTVLSLRARGSLSLFGQIHLEATYVLFEGPHGHVLVLNVLRLLFVSLEVLLQLLTTCTPQVHFPLQGA